MFEKLGNFVAKRRKGVFILFIIGILVSGGLGSQAFSRFDSGGYSDPSSDSAKVAEYLQDTFDVRNPSIVMAVHTKGGSINDPDVVTSAEELESQIRNDSNTDKVISYWSSGNSPFLKSKDGTSGLMFVYLKTTDFTETDKLGGQYQEKYNGTYKNLDVYVSGEAVFANAINGNIQEDLKVAEFISIPLTFLLLLLVFGALVASAMPLVIGVTAIIGTFFVMYLLTLFTDVSIFVLNLTTGLGLGLGIDYALLIVNRFREELAKGLSKESAIVNTMKTAGKTVFYSGLTVVVTLISLMFFPLNFLKSMGYAGASVVALAVFGALIPLPALLVMLGEKVNKGRVRRGALIQREDGRWAQVARFVMRKPITVVAASLAILFFFISPIGNAKFGQVDTDQLPATDRAYISSQFIAEQFPGEEGNPIEIIFPNGSSQPAEISAFTNQLSSVVGIARVGAPQVVGNAVRVEAVQLMKPRTPASEALIEEIRALPSPDGMLVGGVAADYADTQGAIADTLPIVFGWVVLIVLLLLFAFTGSLILPIKAILLNFLSLAATIGVLWWVFGEGNLQSVVGDFIVTGIIDTNMMVLVAIVAFGLSMDYEVFLLSRIKEEHDAGRSNTESVAIGLQKSARIITAAAFILAIVFAAFVTSGVTAIKLLGFGVAFAILLDATLIRALLVPALMRLFGERNWWAPKALKRFQINH
ncbi:MAG: multidrug RND transporter [Actinobacteria bacterium BACL4 MAG-120820-bin23]|jgi:putative drug exporter of the RND superfamily|nr:MAG: multidrug RND transporter [Actinobacteria bacterium BACL4 MAG-120820-bin23]KRO74023.1 MAG: multidrug RND transporter [Actinobacteria bacterium BACL2 MAG-120920-bin34]KRO91969.1 MAG: multidrug RND transporter [Actinobacteria bacterium BACL4 MAG-120507-bin0]